MWEDFMRGNWPVAVPSVPPAPDEAPARRAVADAPVSHAREPVATVTAFAEARPVKRPRRAHRRRMSARLAAAFGAG
jgi:hypothetical protein